MAGLMERTMNIIKAKWSKLLDRTEKPSEQLDYSYEKQLELLQNVKRGVADVVTAKKRLEPQTQPLEQNVVKSDTQARQAVAQGREDLGRQALERKSAAQSQLQGLDGQIKQLEAQQEKLVASEQQLSARVESFRSEKEVIKAQYSAAEAQVRIGEAATGIGEQMADTGAAIQRAKDKTQEMQARANAIDELTASGALEDFTSEQSLLDRELVLELRLQLELFGVVTILLALRDERPEGAALEAVDPVDVRPVAELRLELEGSGEQLAPESRLLQPLRHRVHRGHLVLELGVADDDPLVAEVVRLALATGAILAGDPVEHCLQVVLGANELAGRERLEDDSAGARRLQPKLGVESHPRCREREQPLLCRVLELLTPEEDVSETHSTLGDRAPHLAGDFGEPLQPLVERRMRGEHARHALLDTCRDDEERVHRLDLAQVALRDAEHLARDLLKRAHQVLGRACDQRRPAVGCELAVARDREDQDLTEEVGDDGDQENDQPDGNRVVVVVRVPPAEAAEH